MAIAQHRLTAWIWQATAADRRLGFVEMTRAEFDAAKAEGRAQDPRVGALHLKYITRTPYVPPETPLAAPTPPHRLRKVEPKPHKHEA